MSTLNVSFDKMGSKREDVTITTDGKEVTAQDVRDFLEHRDPNTSDLDLRIEGEELEDLGQTPVKEGAVVRAVPKSVRQG